MMSRLQRRQVVGGDLAEVRGRFRSPFNLEAITRPWLGFRVLHASDPAVGEGTRLAHAALVRGQLRRIVDYPARAIQTRFPCQPAPDGQKVRA